MNTSSRKILMALVGAYLIYTGGNLIKDVLTSQPENQTVFIAAGVLFVIVGLYTIVVNVSAFIKEMKKEVLITEDSEEEEQDAPDDEDMEEYEESEEKKNHVEIVELSSVENTEEESGIEEGDNEASGAQEEAEEEHEKVEDAFEEEDAEEETEEDEDEKVRK